jgi:hypothetical protein
MIVTLKYLNDLTRTIMGAAIEVQTDQFQLYQYFQRGPEAPGDWTFFKTPQRILM